MLSAFFFGCEFSSDINSDAPAKFEYPLNTGNTWEYERVFELYNFRPESVKDIFPFENITTQSIVEVTKDTTLLDTLKCTVLLETLYEFDDVFRTWNYFENKS